MAVDDLMIRDEVVAAGAAADNAITDRAIKLRCGRNLMAFPFSYGLA